MFIGHLAAGYLLATGIKKNIKPKIKSSWLILASLIGSVTPDLDIFYFYLIDNRQHPHHSYFSHYPITWLSLLIIFAISHKCSANKTIPTVGLVFSLSGFIHMLLDSIVGDIWWFAPFSDTAYSVFHITGRYDPWWLNFILHWSFALEVLLILSSAYVFRTNKTLSRY